MLQECPKSAAEEASRWVEEASGVPKECSKSAEEASRRSERPAPRVLRDCGGGVEMGLRGRRAAVGACRTRGID